MDVSDMLYRTFLCSARSLLITMYDHTHYDLCLNPADP